MPPLFDDAAPDEILSLLAGHPGDAKVLSISIRRDPPTQHPPACATLGGLDALPIELLNAVVRHCDLCTASTLCLLNRRARVVVEASVPYKHILHHAPHVVTALARTRVASHFAVDDVFYALSTPACHICSNFGTFLWIPECIRCFLSCLRREPEVMPMGERDAKAAFGLTKSALARVPIVVTLPGTYTNFDIQYRRQLRLLSQKRARQAAIVAHGGEEGLLRYVTSGTSQAKIAYDRRVAARNATRQCFDSRGRINNTIDAITRYMTMVPLPYFDPSSRTTHVGFACRGCQFTLELASRQTMSWRQQHALVDRRDRTFTEKGILEHFGECLGAQTLWNAHQARAGRSG